MWLPLDPGASSVLGVSAAGERGIDQFFRIDDSAGVVERPVQRGADSVEAAS